MTELESLRRRALRLLVTARVLGGIGEVSESITMTSEAWLEEFRKAGPISVGDDAEETLATGSLVSGTTAVTTSSPSPVALVRAWRALVMKLNKM